MAVNLDQGLERAGIYVHTHNALTEALSPLNGGGCLPVPPLLEIIAGYAADCGVSVWVAGAKSPLAVAVLGTSAGGFRADLVLSGVYHGLQRFDSASGMLTTLNWAVNVQDGDTVHGVCIDHLHSNRLFFTTANSVCAVTDGVRSTLCDRFGGGSGIVFTPDRKSLLFGSSDLNEEKSLRAVAIASPHAEELIARTEGVCYSMAWCGAVLYLRCGDSLARYNPDLPGRVIDIRTDYRLTSVCGLACTVSGHILISCWKGKMIRVIDPSTGRSTRLGADVDERNNDIPCGELGTIEIDSPRGIAIVESEYSLAVTDHLLDCIRRVPLPAYHFVPKKR